MKNKLYSLFICISIIFFITITLQYLTFADLSNVFFCSTNENSIINKTSFIISAIYVILYFLIYFVLIYFIQGDFTQDVSLYLENIFSNYGIAYYEIIKNIILPISIYLIYSKIILIYRLPGPCYIRYFYPQFRIHEIEISTLKSHNAQQYF